MSNDEGKQQDWHSTELRSSLYAYVFSRTGNSSSFDSHSLPEDEDALESKLVSLAPKTIPFLVRILQDTSDSLLITHDKSSTSYDAPLARVCRLFGQQMTYDAVLLLDKFRKLENRELRRVCAYAIAISVSQESVPYMLKWLEDTEATVRNSVLHGLAIAKLTDRLNSDAVDMIVRALELLVTENLNVEQVAELLVEIDRHRAGQFLKSIIHEKSGLVLVELLRVLRVHHLGLERDRVQSLLGVYQQRPTCFPNNAIFAELLRQLGTFRLAKDSDVIRRYTTISDSRIRSGAADGLLELYGFHNFRMNFWAMCESWEDMNKSQKYYYAVQMLESEIANGGFDQYFYNSAGDNWTLALEGLDAMQLFKHSQLFRNAVLLFGEKGPSSTRSTRQQQLRLICQEKLEAIESDYFSLEESVEVASAIYVISKSADFESFICNS